MNFKPTKAKLIVTLLLFIVALFFFYNFSLLSYHGCEGLCYPDGTGCCGPTNREKILMIIPDIIGALLSSIAFYVIWSLLQKRITA
ncbi:hypothetical protein GOV09_06210 [Candidatus Woesearchaeota archaeon]|nr:hypothetical protein [Candidatus Woesearchaeota archaeon]